MGCCVCDGIINIGVGKTSIYDTSVGHCFYAMVSFRVSQPRLDILVVVAVLKVSTKFTLTIVVVV